MVRICNCTPHVISLLMRGGEIIDVPPSGIVIRLKEEFKEIHLKDVSDLFKVEFRTFSIFDTEPDLEKIKELAKKYDIILVSSIAGIGLAELHRLEVLSDEEAEKFFTIGRTVRDEKGRVKYAESICPII